MMDTWTAKQQKH